MIMHYLVFVINNESHKSQEISPNENHKNLPLTFEIPSPRAALWCFLVVSLSKLLNKQSSCCDLRHHNRSERIFVYIE